MSDEIDRLLDEVAQHREDAALLDAAFAGREMPPVIAAAFNDCVALAERAHARCKAMM